jgi:hypothetical protein
MEILTPFWRFFARPLAAWPHSWGSATRLKMYKYIDFHPFSSINICSPSLHPHLLRQYHPRKMGHGQRQSTLNDWFSRQLRNDDFSVNSFATHSEKVKLPRFKPWVRDLLKLRMKSKTIFMRKLSRWFETVISSARKASHLDIVTVQIQNIRSYSDYDYQ